MTTAQLRAKLRMHQSRIRQAQRGLKSEQQRLERQRRDALRRLRNLR